MKIACITDTHIAFKKTNINFHNYFEKFYSNIFFPELEKRNIKTVIHLGDAFDNRKGIDYIGLEWAQRVIYDRFRDLGITVYQICGNHDSTMRSTNKYNAIATLLREYSNVIPIVEPEEHYLCGVDILFLPWICKDNEQKSFSFLQETSAKLVFGHLELTGFTLFPGQINTHGMSIEKFEKFDRVFSGHFHTRSSDGRIFYLGNPYQMFWSDVDDQRGFHIFDTKTYDLEFIENPYKIYKKIYYDDSDYNHLNEQELSKKYVKLIVKNKSNETDYNNFISKLNEIDLIDLKIIDLNTLDDSNVDIQNIDLEDTITTLNKYIDDSNFSLDKDMVKKILHQIYKEALELEV